MVCRGPPVYFAVLCHSSVCLQRAYQRGACCHCPPAATGSEDLAGVPPLRVDRVCGVLADCLCRLPVVPWGHAAGLHSQLPHRRYLDADCALRLLGASRVRRADKPLPCRSLHAGPRAAGALRRRAAADGGRLLRPKEQQVRGEPPQQRPRAARGHRGRGLGPLCGAGDLVRSGRGRHRPLRRLLRDAHLPRVAKTDLPWRVEQVALQKPGGLTWLRPLRGHLPRHACLPGPGRGSSHATAQAHCVSLAAGKLWTRCSPARTALEVSQGAPGVAPGARGSLFRKRPQRRASRSSLGMECVCKAFPS
mmetsp:Transcript_63563/g.153753  ORF Transcript_63563/g.153753 Transcript_63563/m.153753 type:complete len:306 (+) Transcript_63563:516-1433(+)